MPRIAIPKREDAPAESKPILDNVDKMLGFVPNLHRLMSISPNALSGWATLMGSLAKTLDVKTRDGIALAVSEADGCDYCLAAHSFIAGNLGKIPADEIELNREGRSSDPKRQAAVAFAKALIETRGKVSDADAHTGLGRGGAPLSPGVPTQGDRATEDRPRPIHLGVAGPRSDRGDRKVPPWTSRRAARGRSGEARRPLA